MGMYTEFHFNAELNDKSGEILPALRYMLGERDGDEPVFPDHPLFQTERWQFMLRSDSYYFDAKPASAIHRDHTGQPRYLCLRCNLKNYSGEIEHFVSWITPYLDKRDGDFLGFQRYEETEIPTLLYHPNRWVVLPETSILAILEGA